MFEKISNWFLKRKINKRNELDKIANEYSDKIYKVYGSKKFYKEFHNYYYLEKNEEIYTIWKQSNFERGLRKYYTFGNYTDLDRDIVILKRYLIILKAACKDIDYKNKITELGG